jgi:hypothetical protein
VRRESGSVIGIASRVGRAFSEGAAMDEQT